MNFAKENKITEIYYCSDNFDENRIELITKLVELASSLKSNYPGILFDYDLPFWLEDEVAFNNVTLPAYKNMINISSRVFLMIINI